MTALVFMFKDGLDANTPIYYSLAVGLVTFVAVSVLSRKPAAVRFAWFNHDHNVNVGAGLLAKTVYQSTFQRLAHCLREQPAPTH